LLRHALEEAGFASFADRMPAPWTIPEDALPDTAASSRIMGFERAGPGRL